MNCCKAGIPGYVLMTHDNDLWITVDFDRDGWSRFAVEHTCVWGLPYRAGHPICHKDLLCFSMRVAGLPGQ